MMISDWLLAIKNSGDEWLVIGKLVIGYWSSGTIVMSDRSLENGGD